MMKMPLSFLGFVAFLLSAAVPVATADTRIRAGAATVDVTPPLPAIYDLMQVATRIGQPLHARVLYLEDDDDRVVFVATDCEGLLRSAYEAIRSAVSGATGVPPRHIVVNSNHSHNAPWFNLDFEALLAPHGLHQVDMGYFRALVGKVADAARRAQAARRPVTVWAGSAQLPELSWNRRTGYVRPEDVDKANRRRKYPIGVTDPTLGLVRLDGADGQPVAALTIYASHYVSAGPGTISPSYPGPAMAEIERELGGRCVALFFQGCAGNITPPSELLGDSPESVEKAGRLLAGRALPALREGMEPVGAGGLDFRTEKVVLPLAPLGVHGARALAGSLFARPAVVAPADLPPLTLADLERRFDGALERYKRPPTDRRPYPLDVTGLGDRLTLARNLEEWSAYDFQVLRAGPLCLVFLPGETCIEVALEIKRLSPYRHTFVSAYNDLTPVYIPDEAAFEEGGYEVGPWCYSTPETARVMVQKASDLVKSAR